MFWIGLVVGAFVAEIVTLFVLALCHAASEGDELMERTLNARYPTRVDVPEIEPY
mgnify:CR=1 FL=1